MKTRRALLVGLAACLSIAVLPQESLSFSKSWGGKGDPCKMKGLEDRAKRLHGCPPYDKKPAPGAAQPTPPTGQKSGATGGPTSGSSEHSSVRGTINGGGDFIAPKLKDKETATKPKPRGVAPRARE